MERDGSPPAWFTPADLISAKSMIGRYPAGNLNCGLAHGAPGLLGILALAHRANVTAAHLCAAIERLAQWLREQCQSKIRESPGRRPSASGRRTRQPRPPSAGVMETQALPEPCGWPEKPCTTRRYAPLRSRRCDRLIGGRGCVHEAMSPTFCHGMAGLLHITMRFANDTAMPDFVTAAERILERLLALFVEDAPFGYRDHDADIGAVDRRGLLDGAAGVALVLLAASSNQAPDWDRIFLLS